MRKYAWILILVGLVALGVILSSGHAVVAQSKQPTPVPGLRTSPAGSSFTNAIGPSQLTAQTLSNPYCYQPDPGLNQCSINIRYYNANDNNVAPYLTYILISINDVIRDRASVFFENSIYYSYDMIPGGLKVPCGTPNQGGMGNQYGALYRVKVEAFDGNNASMGWDQASLACPAYTP